MKAVKGAAKLKDAKLKQALHDQATSQNDLNVLQSNRQAELNKALQDRDVAQKALHDIQVARHEGLEKALEEKASAEKTAQTLQASNEAYKKQREQLEVCIDMRLRVTL